MPEQDDKKPSKNGIGYRLLGFILSEDDEKNVVVSVSVRALVVAYTSTVTLLILLISFYFNFINKISRFDSKLDEMSTEIKEIGSRYDRNIRKLEVETNVLIRNSGQDPSIQLELSDDPVDSTFNSNE